MRRPTGPFPISAALLWSVAFHLSLSALGAWSYFGSSPGNGSTSAASGNTPVAIRYSESKKSTPKAKTPPKSLALPRAEKSSFATGVSEHPVPHPVEAASGADTQGKSSSHPYWGTLHQELSRQLSQFNQAGQLKVEQAPLQLRLTLDSEGKLIDASLPSVLDLVKQGAFEPLPSLPQDLRSLLKDSTFSVSFTIRLSDGT